MPPIRSQPNAKPMKTERTHEENQERAYIAASRRSDRSLEARIESARRASEIHKKRTGRGLRVTEQDVVNEEMYEEEEEDMPHHYRRLQAMMVNMANTGQIFDGRLNSYMIGSLGTRAMMMNGLGMAMPPQLHTPTPFFPYTPPQQTSTSENQSPLTPQAAVPVNLAFNSSQYPSHPHSVQSQQRTHSPPSTEGHASKHDTRKKSPKARQSSTSQPSPVTQSPDPRSPVSPTSSGQQSVHQSPTQRKFFVDPSQNQQGYGAHQQFAYPNVYSAYDPAMGMGMGNLYRGNLNLLSPTLPVEAQQMLGTNTFNASDPYCSSMMDQSHGMAVPTHGLSYSYNPNLSPINKQRQIPNGINQTLSQSTFVPGQKAMETNNSNDADHYGQSPISTNDVGPTLYSSTFNFEPFGLDQTTDGTQTPGETFYPDFFDSNGGQGQHI